MGRNLTSRVNRMLEGATEKDSHSRKGVFIGKGDAAVNSFSNSLSPY